MIIKRTKPKASSKKSMHTSKQTKQQPISKIKLPFKLTRWTIFFAVLALIFCAGVSALVIQHIHNKPVANVSSNSSSKSSDGTIKFDDSSADATLCFEGEANCPQLRGSSNAPIKKTTTAEPSSISTQPKDSVCGAPSSNGYQECIDNVNYINFTAKCDDETSAADHALNAVYNAAQATYNADIAERDQQAESYYPAGSYTLSQVEYSIRKDEITKYNATVAPAWATYQSAFNTINSQGCNLAMTYSESTIMKPTL